jgi:lichenan operon transcriptional antiterminator
LTKNQENLLKYLLKQTEPVTSQIISNKLNISIRTVKSYIKDINSLDSQIIISSKAGYIIVKDKAIDLLNRSKLNIPQNYDERAYYIIKQLLVGKDTSIDAYELCEKLCISYSTLKLDVSKMNSSFEKFEIKFVWKNDALQVIGKEKNKRKLVSHVLYEEANNSSIDLSLLESCFDSNVVKKISDIIVTVFRQYNYYINDFSFMNLVIHFTILINRIRSGNSIDDSSTIIIKDKTELELIELLTRQIEECFNIIVNNSEKSEIYMLFNKFNTGAL